MQNYADAKTCNLGRFSKYFTSMLKNRVYLPPSQFEAVFVSLAHTSVDVEKTLEAVERSFRGI